MKKRYFVGLSGIKKLSRDIGRSIHGGEIFALIGPLGAGKTTFVQELAKTIGVTARVKSPTFVVMQSFLAKPGKTAPKQGLTLHHLDLYRTKTFAEVKALGIEELWGNLETVTLIEWANKIRRHLPKKTTYIYFK